MARGASKAIEDHSFKGYGSHCDDYPHSYLTAAAAIGMTRRDVDLFAKRLDKAMADCSKRKTKLSEPQ